MEKTKDCTHGTCVSDNGVYKKLRKSVPVPIVIALLLCMFVVVVGVVSVSSQDKSPAMVGGTVLEQDRGMLLEKIRTVFVRLGLVREQNNERSPIPRTYTRSLVHGGMTRTYDVHLPATYDMKKKYPLVIVFHGGNGTPSDIAEVTKFSEKADQEGFIVVYPAGVENGWADGRGTSEADKRGVDDVAFTEAIIKDMTPRIDTRNVFATGASNGGMMVYRLACDAGARQLFRAVAPVIANLPTPLEGVCTETMKNTSHALPLVAVNGVEDPLMPVTGGDCCGNPDGRLGLGQGGSVLSVDHSLKLVSGGNIGCEEGEYLSKKEKLVPSVSDGTYVVKNTYQCVAGTQISPVDVYGYMVYGAGHAWYPEEAKVPRVSGSTSANLNTTEIVWDFFEAHQVRGRFY